MQLARHGANVHHVSLRPDGTTALHECVARGHDRVADLLLNYGASPFLENGRGMLQACQWPHHRGTSYSLSTFSYDFYATAK